MIVCYDLETFKNLFTATFVDLKTGVASAFVIHKSRNDLDAMLEYLRGVEGLVGFNNVGFDYPVLHLLLVADHSGIDGDTLAKKLYKRAQVVTDKEWRRDYEKPLIPQRDLFRIWHFNNKARYTSLKYLQINMGWHNVQEMPIPHTKNVEEKDIPLILEYNLNDVLSTIEFYHLSKDRIKMRKTLGEKYGRDFGNASDTNIGERIFMLEMSKRTGVPEKEIASRRTFRKNIVLKNCIADTVKFESKEFNQILTAFKNKTIQSTRKAKEDEPLFVYFDGMKYEFGFGGLHAFREAGVYENIVSADVASYYPNLAISYRFYPHHLGEVFCDVYQHLYEERKRYKKGSDESNAIKLALNGVYGMSNAEWSPFYDPFYTMSITINGQLMLAQLCEMITLSGAGIVVMANTDGIEVDVRDSERFERVCSEWQTLHRLQLEFSKFRKLAVRDCNNYLGVKTNGDIKEKGDYVCDREIHKDQSMKIVTLAVRRFFVDDVPPEQTISECKDIGMFLMGKRARIGNLEYRRADTELVREELPKNVRYYVSRTGGSIVKVLTSTKKPKIIENQIDPFGWKGATETVEERIVNIHVGYKQVIFNKFERKPFEEYNLDLNFYVREAKKLINAIIRHQTEIA